jgi:hypothetical protein
MLCIKQAMRSHQRARKNPMADYPLTPSKHHKGSRISTEATRVFHKVQEIQKGLPPDEAWLNRSNYSLLHFVHLA